MAQVLVFRKPAGHGWIASVLMPSLDPRSAVPNAVLYVAKALDVETRREVDIRALGTGKEMPPPIRRVPRRMAGVPVHVLDDC